MRRRVLPLNGGAGSTGLPASSCMSTRRHGGSGGAAATSRSHARKEAKSNANSSKPVDPAHKKPSGRGNKTKSKQQLAAIAITTACIALALAVTSLGTPPASDAEAADRFLEWFQAAGGRADNVSVAAFPGMGKGVIARKSIRQGDEMLFVPKDIVMCADTIFKSPTAPNVLKKLRLLQDQEDELLTAFLLLEQLQGPASRWSPYLDLLPQMPQLMGNVHVEAASPLFFISDDLVEQLQDPHMITTALAERSAAQRAFRRFNRLFGRLLTTKSDSQANTMLQYQWARFLVNSRAFSIRGRRFLVPFGDFFNGQAHSQARIHDNGRHFLDFHELQDIGMVIRADRDTKEAQQVFEDYGDNDNYVYFLYHGFLMPNNPFDCAMVRLPTLGSPGSDGDDDVLEMKMRVLRHFGVADRPSVCISTDGSIREAPLAQMYAKLYRTSIEQLTSDCRRVEQYAKCFLDHDASNMEDDSLIMSMSQFAVDAVRDQLAAYPTTANQDEQLLRELTTMETDDPRTVETNEHAIRLRLSRKRVLIAAVSSLEQQIRDATGDSDAAAPSQSEARDSKQSEAGTETFPPHGDRLERFKQWIESLAFPINHLELRYVDDVVGYGTFATKPLEQGDVYLRVPVDAVMNVRSAVQSPPLWLSQVARALGSEHTADNWLTLHLLDEKFGPRSEQSRWKPYLDMLPSMDAGRMGSPLFYPQDGPEMKLLARTDLLPLVQNYQRRVQEAFKSLTRALKTLDNAVGVEWLTLDRYMWATVVLDSRSIWWGGQRHLVPLLDMVNCRELAPNKVHKAHETQLAGEDGQFADTRASWTFQAGEQVVENYGQPNYIYLLYHGFVLADNSHDCAHLRVDFSAGLQADEPRSMGLRQRLASKLELMGVYSWRWDVCVDADDVADVARLAHLAPFAVAPERALSIERLQDKTVSLEEVDAALELVKTRLEKLDVSTEGGQDCDQCGMVVEYVAQQRRHLRRLYSRLEELSNR